MPTGLQIRTRVFTLTQERLGFEGKATALASDTVRLRDATRFDMAGLAPQTHANDFVRITSTSNSDRGFVGMVQYIDPQNGDVVFDPPDGAAIVSGATYELYEHGIRPDDYDRARDTALTVKCAPWRNKPLSLISQVHLWATAAYSATAGGVTDATGSAAALAFPRAIFDQGMTVTNTGASGIISSEMLRVQPTQQYRLFGRVSVAAQTASIRVRDLTNGADITLTGDSTFTLNGEQWFEVTFTIPTDCGRIQVWLGGASASCVATWMGVGLQSQHDAVYNLESRVLSQFDVGHLYEYSLPSSATGRLYRHKSTGVVREHAGVGVAIVFDDPPTRPVYYMEKHHYTALQSTYFSLTDRTTGDDATTDCPLDYAAWGLIVALLEHRDILPDLLQDAINKLRFWDGQVGAQPIVAIEHSEAGGIYLARI